MAGISSNIPDYLPQLVDELIKEGATHSSTLFRKYWTSLPAERRDAPCPFCFSKGIDAPLVIRGRGALRDHLQCTHCERFYVVLEPGQLHGNSRGGTERTGTTG